jgi:NAD(P)-dependent dehydrogenase (short-subunit alcohol dehydrogenase family)
MSGSVGIVSRDMVVAVVGGTGGIGAAIAQHFADAGAATHAFGLAADGVPERLRATADVREVDVTADGQLEQALAGLSRLDVLVNAAGIIRRDEEYRPEVFARVIEVNLTAAMRACVAARPMLAITRGSIVNVASMLTFFGGPRVPAYSASKGGIAALTRSLAVAWGPDGIRVNAVAPGWIRTPLTHDLHTDRDAAERIVARTPLGRWGEPSDVTGAVEFLASPSARFVTGAVIPVDGGYLIA